MIRKPKPNLKYAAPNKLTVLMNAGIRHSINRMESDERNITGHLFVPYGNMMESIAAKIRISVTFDQLPIKDLSVPTERYMAKILNQIDLCIKYGKPVYVHCLGGIGRTGTVVGCYLVSHGLGTWKNALDIIRDLRKDCGKIVKTLIDSLRRRGSSGRWWWDGEKGFE